MENGSIVPKLAFVISLFVAAFIASILSFSVASTTHAESFGAEYRLQERQTKALEQIARELGRLERCK